MQYYLGRGLGRDLAVRPPREDLVPMVVSPPLWPVSSDPEHSQPPCTQGPCDFSSNGLMGTVMPAFLLGGGPCNPVTWPNFLIR